MGLLDNIKGALKGNTDKVKDGIDKAANMIDEKTDGKYSDKIDMAADKVDDLIDRMADDAGDATRLSPRRCAAQMRLFYHRRMANEIRIFVGSAPERIVEETVLVDSIRRNATRPVAITVLDCSAEPVLRDAATGERTPLPDHWGSLLSGGTLFSFARFTLPELCDFEGRAIYVDCDMLVFGDVAELWDLDLGGAAFAAVPSAAVRGDFPDFADEGYLSSAIVVDAARCASMRLETIRAAVDDGTIDYLDALSLTPRGRSWFGLELVDLDERWNDLERWFSDTRLLHFTDGQRQPWLHPGHPENARWRRAYLSCVQRGLIDGDTLETAFRLRGISRRTKLLAKIPRPVAPLFDAAAQRRELANRRRAA